MTIASMQRHKMRERVFLVQLGLYRQGTRSKILKQSMFCPLLIVLETHHLLWGPWRVSDVETFCSNFV